MGTITIDTLIGGSIIINTKNEPTEPVWGTGVWRVTYEVLWTASDDPNEQWQTNSVSFTNWSGEQHSHITPVDFCCHDMPNQYSAIYKIGDRAWFRDAMMLNTGIEIDPTKVHQTIEGIITLDDCPNHLFKNIVVDWSPN